MIYEMKSAALAARARMRGPTVSEQRAAAEAAMMFVEKKTKEKKSGSGAAAAAAEGARGKPAKLTRGRVRANAAQITVAGQKGSFPKVTLPPPSTTTLYVFV